MKLKKLSVLLCTALLLFALPLFAACAGGDVDDGTVPVISIGLDTQSIEIAVGDTYILTATVLPSNATDKSIEWKSSDSTVASVSDGKITALKTGEAVITATSGGKSADCAVTVKEAKKEEIIPVTSLTLSKTELEVEVGATYKLVATVLPANATDRTVVWSSDNACATVDNGVVTGMAQGKAKITAKADGKSAVCIVSVIKKSQEQPTVSELSLDVTSLSMTEGETKTLNAVIKPDTAKDVPVTWSSSNERVVTVSKGAVNAVGEGTATVTATAGGRSATCNVTVTKRAQEEVPVTGVTLDITEKQLTVGDIFTLTATVMPENATNKEVVWSTNDGAVATVENGVVTAKGKGSAKIRASVGSVYAECEIGVTEKDVPVNPESIITYARAGEECASFEWKDTDASKAKVEYKLASQTAYTRADAQLVRQISPTLARVDVVGLKGGQKYNFRITSGDGKQSVVEGVQISPYDRSGYSHFNYTGGVGAYNDDGTLKANAVVIYLTEENKNNVDGKGNSIAEYLTKAYNNSAPIVVRVIGTVGSATWNSIEYNAAGKEGDDITVDKVKGINGKALPTAADNFTQQKLIEGGYNTLNYYPEKLGGKRCEAIDGLISKAKYTAASGSSPAEYDSAWNDCQVKQVNNITIEGIGEDAEIFQWGFTFKNCNSVEVRNLRFYDYTEDACSIEGSENSKTLSGFKHKNFWIHHNTFDLGVNYWDVCPEQDKHDGDGATDFKYIAYLTVSYNRYNETHKTGLVGGGDTAHQACFTFHHNYYNSCDQRLPLGRQANMHLYNNYYYNSGIYSISLRAGAYAFVENCVFTSKKSTTRPIELVKGSEGIPSCKVVGSILDKDITNGVGEEYLYVGTDRLATVSGENLYGQNFDTNAALFYYDAANKCSKVTNLLPAGDVAKTIPEVAGVMKRVSNISIGGGSQPVIPDVPDVPDTPDVPDGTQSLKFEEEDEGTAYAVDGAISEGSLFTATWNTTKATVSKGVSPAAADDESGLTFAFALLSNGTGGGVTVTAKENVTLTVYYGASDSKFTVADQSKGGNLVWTVDGGEGVTSTKTDSKSNKVAYSQIITLSKGQKAVFTISSNRFVLYGLTAGLSA